ncbi:MAG TPA: hypothetical protein PLC98_19985 [Anaerolineales bacterium]|nr:hypothetical protein [Anaerolineales bacterium]
MNRLLLFLEVLGWLSFILAPGIVGLAGLYVPWRLPNEVVKQRGTENFMGGYLFGLIMTFAVAYLLLNSRWFVTVITDDPGISGFFRDRGMRLAFISIGLTRGISAHVLGAYGISGKMGPLRFITQEDFALVPKVALTQISLAVLAGAACLCNPLP